MKAPSVQRGILLLESLVAILIISFGVLGLIGLWANSVKNASEAKYRSDATFLANEVVGQLWLTRPLAVGCNPPANWTARVAAMLPEGVGDVCVAAPDVAHPTQLEATVTVTWQLPGHLPPPHVVTVVTQVNGAGPI